MGGFGRLQRKVESYFDDERLQRLFSFQSLYAGLRAQYEALALFGVITYMDTVAGALSRGGVHQLPLALAGAVEKAGARMIFGDGADEVLLSGGDRGRGTRGTTRVRRNHHRRRGRLQRRASVRVPTAAAVPLLASAPPPRSVLAVGVRVARGSPRRTGARGRASQYPLRARVEPRSFTALLATAAACLIRRSSSRSRRVTDPAPAPAGCSTIFALEPVPNLDGRVDWSRERAQARDEMLRASRRPRLSHRCRSRGRLRPDRLACPRTRTRHAVLGGAPFLPIRTVPYSQRRRPRAGLVFAGAGTVPGVGVPMVVLSGRLAAERRRGVHAMTFSPDLARSYARCRAVNRRHGHDLLLVDHGVTPRRTPARARVVRASAGTPTTSSTTSDRRRLPIAARSAARVRQPVSRRSRQSVRRNMTMLAAVVHTVRRYDIPTDCFDRFLRSMDNGSVGHALRDVRRSLGYMDGSAAVIGEMMLPVLSRDRAAAATGPRARHRLPADELPARRRRGSRTRPDIPPAR